MERKKERREKERKENDRKKERIMTTVKRRKLRRINITGKWKKIIFFLLLKKVKIKINNNKWKSCKIKIEAKERKTGWKQEKEEIRKIKSVEKIKEKDKAEEKRGK